MRSWPSPSTIRSRPAPPAAMSSPSDPATTSSPRPPCTPSSPAPPATMSRPLPAKTRSSPSPASTVSAPRPEKIRSFPAPARTRSSPGPVRRTSSSGPRKTRLSVMLPAAKAPRTPWVAELGCRKSVKAIRFGIDPRHHRVGLDEPVLRRRHPDRLAPDAAEHRLVEVRRVQPEGARVGDDLRRRCGACRRSPRRSPGSPGTPPPGRGALCASTTAANSGGSGSGRNSGAGRL